MTTATRKPYAERIAAEAPADLIAAEAPPFIDGLKTKHMTFACVGVSYAQARQNKAYVEAEVEALRSIWRAAKANAEGWRDALAAFAEKHKADSVASVRFRLIAQRAGTLRGR